jgi:hypothetical protein
VQLCSQRLEQATKLNVETSRILLLIYLKNRVGRNIPCRARSKDESISLNVKIGKAVRHHQDWRSVSRPLDRFIVAGFGHGRAFDNGAAVGVGVGIAISSITAAARRRQVVPKLDSSKERFGMTPLVRALVFIVSIGLGQDGVSARRKYEKVANHCTESIVFVDRVSVLALILCFGRRSSKANNCRSSSWYCLNGSKVAGLRVRGRQSAVVAMYRASKDLLDRLLWFYIAL